MEMFEKATKLKLRYNTKQGIVTVEDLWDLPLTSRTKVNLDDIYKDLASAVNNKKVASIITKSDNDDKDTFALDVLTHIIGVRLKEKEALENAKSKAEFNKLVLETIAEKEHEGLKSKSIEELKAMV